MSKQDYFKISGLFAVLAAMLTAVLIVSSEETDVPFVEPAEVFSQLPTVDDSNFSQDSTLERAYILLNEFNWEDVFFQAFQNDDAFDIKDEDVRDALVDVASRYMDESLTGVRDGEFEYLYEGLVAANYNPSVLSHSIVAAVPGVDWEQAVTFQAVCEVNNVHAEDFEENNVFETGDCATVDWRQQQHFGVYLLVDSINLNNEKDFFGITVNIKLTEDGYIVVI